MSQIITESQAFHHNTFAPDPPIHTKVEHNIFTISSNNEIPLFNEFLSAERQSLIIDESHFDSGFDGKEEKDVKSTRDSSSVESLPIIKIDLNNNNNNDLEKVFEDGKERKQSLTISEPANYEPACILPTTEHPSSCDQISSNHVTVSGADVSDIPTSYVIPKLAPHEKAVVGTFVDLMITPGYPYRLRLNGTDDFLFGGKPLTLLSVGQGYGKRLTFHSDDILNNNHYFWSDSNPPNGFAVSICLSINGEFLIKTKDGRIVGRSAVTSVNEEQVINKLRCPLKHAVELEVKVQFTCTLSRFDLQSDWSELTLQGVAIATKSKHGAVVGCIENILVPGCGECIFEKNEQTEL